jgi:hypothetical protein
MRRHDNARLDGAGAIDTNQDPGDGISATPSLIHVDPLRHDPLCGRCGGPSGPEGAWCDQCINECCEYTQRLDNQAGGDQA